LCMAPATDYHNMFLFASLVAFGTAVDDSSLLQAQQLHSHYAIPWHSNPRNVDTVICPFLKSAVVSLGLELQDAEGVGRTFPGWPKKSMIKDTELRHTFMSLESWHNFVDSIQAEQSMIYFLDKTVVKPSRLAENPLNLRGLDGTFFENIWSTGVNDPSPSRSRFKIWESVATDGYIGAKEIAQAVPEFNYRALADQKAGDDVGQWALNPPAHLTPTAQAGLAAAALKDVSISSKLSRTPGVAGFSWLLTFFGECGFTVQGCEGVENTCRMGIDKWKRLLLKGEAKWQRGSGLVTTTQECVSQLLPGYYALANASLPLK